MNIKYQDVELHTVDDEIMGKYQDLVEKRHSSYIHDEVLRSLSYRIKSDRIPPMKNAKVKRILGFAGEEIVCTGYASFKIMDNDQNPHKIRMEVFVLPEYRLQGIATNLMKELIDFAKEHNKTEIDGGFYPINTPAASKWAEKMDFKLAMREKVSRLYKDKINWDFIKQTEEKYRDLASKYTYERYDMKRWTDQVLSDDDFAERLADYFTEVDNLLPREEADWNDVVITAQDMRDWAENDIKSDNFDSIDYLALDGDKIIAFSGSYYPRDPPVRDVGTGLTGVRKAYQRQGLATYLKILVTKDYVKNFPDFAYIYTENAGSNDGMLSINYALGYETYFVYHFYQGKVEQVDKILSNVSMINSQG